MKEHSRSYDRKYFLLLGPEQQHQQVDTSLADTTRTAVVEFAIEELLASEVAEESNFELPVWFKHSAKRGSTALVVEMARWTQEWMVEEVLGAQTGGQWQSRSS